MNISHGKKIGLPRIEDVLYKNEVIEGKFFRAEPSWVDFEQGYILNRDEIDEIVDNLKFDKIQLLIGDSGSGKSIILKGIGFKLSRYKSIYYIESKKYDASEVEKYLKEILRQNENAIFILDDIHIHQKKYEDFLSYYKNIGKGYIILGSRDTFLFERHQKYMSILDNIKKIPILASNVADKLIELYLNKTYNLDSSKIAFISSRLSDYKVDLWFLSWALLAYKPEYSSVSKIDIYNKVADFITDVQGKNGVIDASNIFFILSVFSRFEIPVEKRFLIKLGIELDAIEELIISKEIAENRKNNTISIIHASIAEIYFNTYKYFPGLGHSIRNLYRNDESYSLFLDYLNTKPFNFYGSLVQLCNDSFDKKEGKMLASRLIENPQIRDNISKLEGTGARVADIALCIAKLKKINSRLAADISNNIDVNQLADKLNLEGSTFDISISLLTLKGINLPLAKNLIKKLNIGRISNKLRDENIYNILATLMSFYSVDYTIAYNLVNEMLMDNDNKDLLDIMLNEGTIFINSLITFYIAYGNTEAAIDLMHELKFNSIAENTQTEDDFVGLQIFLLILNTKISRKAKISLNITHLDVNNLINLLKGKNVLDNSHFIWSLTLANKEAAVKLINNHEYIEYLGYIIRKETNLEAIAILLIWVSCANKKIAIDLIESIEISNMLEKIQNAEKLDGISFLLICLASIDRSLATKYYVFSIAYAKKFLAFELIKEMDGVAPNININKFMKKLSRELNGILSLSLTAEYVCLYQLIDSWTLSFG